MTKVAVQTSLHRTARPAQRDASDLGALLRELRAWDKLSAQSLKAQGF